jgi:hypothetical protein
MPLRNPGAAGATKHSAPCGRGFCEGPSPCDVRACEELPPGSARDCQQLCPKCDHTCRDRPYRHGHGPPAPRRREMPPTERP